METTVITNAAAELATGWGAVLLKYAIGLLNVLLATLVLCIPVVCRYVNGWIASKIKRDDNAEAREAREARLRRIEEIIMTCTAAVTQTYVSELKEKARDGKLTQEERQEAMSRTLLMVKKHLIAEGIDEQLEILAGVLPDYIEEAIARLKVDK